MQRRQSIRIGESGLKGVQAFARKPIVTTALFGVALLLSSCTGNAPSTEANRSDADTAKTSVTKTPASGSRLEQRIGTGAVGNNAAPTTSGAATGNAANAGNPATAVNPESSATTNVPTAPQMTGDPVDLTLYDAAVKRYGTIAQKNPRDAKAQQDFAQAYVDRAAKLTEVRQYRAALGDWRRALKYDPNNQEAQMMVGTIESILREMGRPIPEPGKEPAPLPLTNQRVPFGKGN